MGADGWWDGRASAPAVPARVEICPPARRCPALGWRQRLLEWLAGSWPVDASEADAAEEALDDEALEPVREEFAAALADVSTAEARQLVWRIRCARSLRELWHLRTELFNVVARSAGQCHATARLQPLNRHFPARAPRSGFGGFDAEPHGRRA